MNDNANIAERMLDNLATAVLLLDKNMHIISMNSAAEDLLSISSTRVTGMDPKQVWPNASFFYDAIRNSVWTGNTCIERGVDMHLHHAVTIKVDCMITPIMVNDEAEEIMVELVSANAFLRVMQEVRQKTVQEAAKEAIQGMAHEIKNPLGGIRGAAQLLEKELINTELSEYTQLIINEADRLRKFIDRMLTTSNQPLKRVMNVHEMLEYVVSVVVAENSRKPKVYKDYDPSIPDIFADREQIIQAVLNLLRNAVQAIAKDGYIKIKTRIKRQITLQHQLHRHVIEIQIIDDGPGIPAEIEADAFYPMITGRPEGTGLGLSIAQQMIQLHDGLIDYERKNDETCFTIFLPRGVEDGE